MQQTRGILLCSPHQSAISTTFGIRYFFVNSNNLSQLVPLATKGSRYNSPPAIEILTERIALSPESSKLYLLGIIFTGNNF